MMRIAYCIAVALAIAGSVPARADYARLQWQYECLKQPDAVCYDATPSGVDPLAPPAPVTAAPPVTSPALTVAAPSAPPERKPRAAKAGAGEGQAADPLRAIAMRLQAHKPTASDMTTLEARAKAGNARALELLAWAELVGVGVARDPVQAYFHYGLAAAAGAPTGRRDQALVFEGSLTAEERQQVLVIENGKLPADRP
jgi:hypothetical protein